MEKSREFATVIVIALLAGFVLRGALGFLSYTVGRVGGACLVIGALALAYHYLIGKTGH